MLMFFIFLTVTCHAQSVSSADLINNTKEYDDKIVTYKGEVIGDIMVRGEYGWININDDVNAIGIWIPKAMTKDIAYSGTYNKRGDVIEVTGVFHRACAEHGGDLDIHAERIARLKDGYAVTVPLDMVKVQYAAIFSIILAFVSAWKIYKKFLCSKI